MDIYQDVRIHELSHQNGVLSDHQRTGTRKDCVVVELDIVWDQHVEDFCLQKQVDVKGQGERHLYQHRQGELPDANNRFSEGEYDNRNNLKDEQRNTIHIIPSA